MSHRPLVSLAVAANVAALAAPSTTLAASAPVLRQLPAAQGVVVAFDSRAVPRHAVTVARFTSNHLALRSTRTRQVVLTADGRGVLAHLRPGRASRVRVTLDSVAGRVTLRSRGRTVRVARHLVPERAVALLRHLSTATVRPFGVATKAAARTKASAPAPAAAAPATGTTRSASALIAQPARLFSPTSVWNQPLAADAPLDPASSGIVGTLRTLVSDSIAKAIGPTISTSQTSPMYVVGPDQPMVPVKLDTGTWGANLQKALTAVPIPADAAPASGPDRHMTIYQPSTDRMWEFYHASKLTDGWHAEWGGAMNTTSTSPGYYNTTSWSGLSGTNWGATATSLPVMAGTMTVAELRAGVIPHALAINVPTPRAKSYSWPAQHSDGSSTAANSIPEGARFRLDPNLDINSLNLPPLIKAMAVAAQRYGLIVRDKTSYTLGFFAENPRPYYTTTNPYTSPGGIFNSRWSGYYMPKFPWSHLQLVKMDLHS
jgi:hypothetical protein